MNAIIKPICKAIKQYQIWLLFLLNLIVNFWMKLECARCH